MSLIDRNPHLGALDTAIDECFTDMNSITVDDEKYDKMTNQLIKLLRLREELTNKETDYELKREELNIKRADSGLKQDELDLKREQFEFDVEETKKKPKISYETLALIGGNLLGIVMILNHERANVVASKALSFVAKLK